MNKPNLSQWSKVLLSQVVTHRRGISYNSNQLADRTSNFPLYINMKSFRKDASYNQDGEKFFADQFTEKDPLQEDELLVVNTDVTPQGEILGVPVRLPHRVSNTPTLFSHHVTALKHNKLVSKIFLYYLLSGEETRRVIRSFGRGTTVKMLNFREVLETEILLPTIQEQQKIAEILTSVDEVIENTQSQINKLEDLKKATMNELLTKGIGHTEFKETEIGRIPRSWSIQTIGEYVDIGRGFAFKSEDYESSGVPIVRVTNISSNNELNFDTDVQYLSCEKSLNYGKYWLEDDDFLLVMVGATVGKYARVRLNGKKALLNQNMWKLRVKDDIRNSQQYAIYSLQLTVLRFLRTQQGSARDFLTQTEFSKQFVIIPPLSEQRNITKILESLERDIDAKSQLLLNYKSLKQSIMQDLLTGKVRVTVN
jgi:type I restriction enzyme S subunit